MIDLTQGTIIKKDSKPIKLKLPSLSHRHSIVTVREQPKIKRKVDSTQSIQKILVHSIIFLGLSITPIYIKKNAWKKSKNSDFSMNYTLIS